MEQTAGAYQDEGTQIREDLKLGLKGVLTPIFGVDIIAQFNSFTPQGTLAEI